ncbi:carbohydrate ABC transporter substrate-binding protein [Leucobacter aridicollis]|uniref:Multiple sugar transport system substrate-binding protein n=1 Tax=Leucobacter aridicollis TaxID=283878 RepID=A0A852RCT7_9MICO|nr:carbohydrate ABC transporter substrate-binding protein [Leucobacter aridicollis]MBL3683884.1 carbohydrate ABC transporter substrate-binding protein [Leucobacter aridicollis]NYD28209.1 multiple sugar transport system substrate-binding protein [Leucobacter aridicollis]
MTYRGLTWDHPRGRQALERTALAAPGLIEWEVHSLEGFEASPIEELAEQYDVLVLDHPHLGDALAAGALIPVEAWLGEDALRRIAADAVGPSLRSYEVGGRTWALPLDAASQVSARLPERVAEAPVRWEDVLQLAQRVPVAPNLGGPHALLSYLSICVALGEDPAVDGSELLVSEAVGSEAARILIELARTAPAGAVDLNPIGLLERMRDERDIAYVPLVYGYVNYASGPGALAFANAPVGPAGRTGSVIGGTGLAISTRTQPDARLVDMLTWLMHPLTQATVISEHAGQPSSGAAWANPEVNRLAGEFYAATRRTINEAWVRPRLPGFTAFQASASRLLRDRIAASDASGAWRVVQREYAHTLAGAKMPAHR